MAEVVMDFQHETQLVEDGMALPGFPPITCKFGSSEDDFADSDDMANSRTRTRPAAVHSQPFTDSKLMIVPTGHVKRELRRQHLPHVWFSKRV